MSVHQKRLKVINLSIGGTSFECQLQSWTLAAGIKDGNRMYTYCSDTANNSFIEETDDEPSLQLKFFADYRSAGISDYLWTNSLQVAAFTLDHHPDVVGEHVRWAGNVLLKAPDTGGDARTTELTDVTLLIVGSLASGALTYTRIG
jgi:hypothetical protein